MTRLRAALAFALLACLAPVPALASGAIEKADAAPVADVPPVRGADWEERVALATRMHEIQPSKDQVDDAVVTVAQRLPQQERKGFEIAMKKILDYKTLEKASIEAMAEIYTLPELKAMVAYNETPEARSISRKFEAYQGRIQPKVFEMLDRAMMQVRTGTAPGQAKP